MEFLKISEIKFKADSLVIVPKEILIIVGPNNAGKTVCLSEIENHLRGKLDSQQVVESIKISYDQNITADIMWESLKTLNYSKIDSASINIHPISKRSSPESTRVAFGNISDLFSGLLGFHLTETQEIELRKIYTGLFTFRIRADERLTLLEGHQRSDFRRVPEAFLQLVYDSKETQRRLRKLVFSIFNLYFAIDPLSNTYIVRLGKEEPITGRIHEISTAMKPIYDQMKPLREFGDGIRAFVSLITSICVVPHRFILIDDPEVYLHPPIARRLGTEMARIAIRRNGQLLVTTHSADFLFGCLEATDKATIIRLTYDYHTNLATAKVVNPELLSTILHDRLLRSTGALNGLFHRGVVVVESEEDRVFYEEINRRLVNKGRGADDVLFLNAQNWQTTGAIVGPLRTVGVPASVILDIDVLSDQRSVWKHIIDGCQLTDEVKNCLTSARDELKKCFPTKGETGSESVIKEEWSKFKKLGLGYLETKVSKSSTEYLNIENAIKKAAEFGVHIVPKGELESWLSVYGVSGNGSRWVRLIFEKMGISETDDNYAEPTDDDVWEFIDSVGVWINDENRYGMS